MAQHLAAHGSGHAHPGGVAGDPMGEYYDMFGSPYYEAYDELGYQVYTCSTVTRYTRVALFVSRGLRTPEPSTDR